MAQRTPPECLPDPRPGRFRKLSDEQWNKIKDFLPGREGHVGANARNNRLFVDAVLYRYYTGVPWRDIPEYFGNWKNIHRRFSRWNKAGVFQKIFDFLAKESNNEYEMIDSTIVRAHQHSAGARKNEEKNNETENKIENDNGENKNYRREAIGRSRGGLSTKINTLSDAVGNPVAFHLTGGQDSDLEGSDVLLPKMKSDTLLGDKGYDADERVRDRLNKMNKKAVIPSKKNRKVPHDYDKELYKARHKIENFFAKLKQFRAIATRYEKTVRNFLGGIYLVSILILLH